MTFKTSIATVSISGALSDKLRAIAEAGYGGAEIFENDLLSAPESAREIGALMRDLNLACTMFQPFRDLEGLPDDLRARAFERMKRKFEVMEQLGTDLVLLCSNCSPHAMDDRQRMLDDLHELGEMAAAHGKRVGYEALAWGRHVADHRDSWALVRDCDHPAIGLVLDGFHSLARRIPSASIGDIRPEKLFIVQVADAPMLDMDYLNWSRHFRCMPGQGDFPLAEWAAAIARTGYDGWWSLEIFNDRFRAGSAHQVARDGHRSLRLLEDQAARLLKRPSPMPPRVAPRGVEFIEFAASHEEAEDFARVFRALGFAPVGQHRSKDVTRWAQGEINLVVNSEPEGLAHSFDIVHGGSVCAIGLAVPDQQAALDRAQALDIPRFAQQVGPDEWEIPSLRGVGGSLLYLVDAETRDAMWADEFPRTVEPAPAKPLLSRVDHIAQTMQYEEMLSWLLYYHALLDVKKTPQLEIADPMGLVYSQAVETADGALRFTLNGSMAVQSLSSRFIQAYFGAGVQHIAFASEDVFAAAQAAADAGLPMLDIGPNYYEDLEAKYALDPELLARMERLNILYDRDGDAEYFQFYTRAVAKRVFFEVVERRGYDGYGAVNAPIRLNAQAKYRDPLV
ncbi:bifunctional sugar phosphate isomerase/epimerase/4-hydroxyphenylpyruvate dioxygenase family protein [Novosphingobium humi]|uniref:3-dehydroshikimate dehydratase n=1 Tax=Novosphingobium humi TaxID=2282397 RepID=A0ABY7TSM6_9SPHN|nr:sugar phosphate isomerase/epimerase and 4-hydroxyphenylpyruvate domain-containing protein [Novosphingobium humi]WCT76217.1 TIM barrel protein [Novosphingobium humi]WJS97321.1 sugar phosphate isomerase/epimerase and 4-hydroxyphenylpyruvate domain-containing protein [Novosphingobium humi]